MPATFTNSEPFSNVDAAWLHMEKPTNMAMITGVMMFDGPMDFERLKDTVRYRLLPYKRFRQVAKDPRFEIGLPRWEYDPDFDLDYHLQRVRLPEPAGQAELQELVSRLMSTQLDFSRPLWQYHFVENYNGGSALVARLHHCIADGVALISVLLNMTDDSPDAPWPAPPSRSARKPLSPLTRLILPAVEASQSVRKTWRQAELLLHEGVETLIHPSRFITAAKLGLSGTKALGKLLLIPPDQKTLFRGKCGIDKRAAWSEPVPLEDIKSIGRLMNGTINDVLLAAVSGALRRYLEDHGQPTAGLDIRAVVPVNLRQNGEEISLGNRFGLVFLSLPVGERDPIRRLAVLKQRMDAIKGSPEAIVAFGILYTIGMTPKQIEDIICMIFGMKGTAVMTNVPGPRQPLYLAGQKLDNLLFWVPSPANLGMGVSILSYAGSVTVGFATDVCLVPDPEAIVANFRDELEQLKSWGRPPKTSPIEPASQPVVEPIAVPPHVIPLNGNCAALTKSGLPCRNKALPGSATCRVHRRVILKIPA